VSDAATRDMKRTALSLFRGLARSYDLTVDLATLFQDRYWKKWVAERSKTIGAGLTLDVGCGTLLLEERYGGRGRRFVGLDLTGEMIRVGQSKWVPNMVLLVRGEAESLPFQDGAFDSVVSCYVAKYVNVDILASELARVTKPGASVVLYDFARPRGPLAPFIEMYIQGGMRVIGFLMKVARRQEAFAFGNLPWIVDRTSWDSEVAARMEQRGFETVAAERLTGGVVFAYCGKKPGSP